MTRLSLVYCVRDPDYGGGLLHRMQASLSTFADIAATQALDYEVVVVEWNPPGGKPRIMDLVVCPPGARGRVRFIEVPTEVHRRFENADQMPIFEYVGKNVGIRRARGEWVLACSPDVILNNALVRFLARGRLAQDAFYRIDRWDVDLDVPLDRGWRQRLRACERNVVTINSREGSFPPPVVSPRERVAAALRQRVRPEPEVIDASDAPLHTNASGDFLLMSRESWQRLRGYTECYTHAHIDSIMCWTARSVRMRQMILAGGMRLFHQEHDRSAHRDFPETDWRQWHERYLEAMERGEPLIANGEDWGLPDQVLEERTL